MWLRSWSVDQSVGFWVFVIAFLPRSKCLLISWLQSPSTVILQPKKRKSVTASTFSTSLWSDGTLKLKGPDAVIFVFLILSFKPAFSLSSSTLIKKLFKVPLPFLPLEWYLRLIWGSLYACLLAQSCLTLCEPYGVYSGLLHQGVIHLEYICKYFLQKTWLVIFVLVDL